MFSVDVWGFPPISLEECMCGCKGGFLLTGGDAWHISPLGPFLLLAFASSLRSPPFLSSAERQDGGAVAGVLLLPLPGVGLADEISRFVGVFSSSSPLWRCFPCWRLF